LKQNDAKKSFYNQSEKKLKPNKAKEAKYLRLFLKQKKRNACETDLVSLCFALKRKKFEAKPAHPNDMY